jgi:hypothetical protein
MLILAAVTQEPQRGWGGPIALLIAGAIFIAFATGLHQFQEAREARRNPSPTPPGGRGVRVKPQVSAGSDTDDTDRDTDDWQGRIVQVDGAYYRVYPRPDAGVDEDDVDLELDEPDEETIEQAVIRMDGEGVPYNEMVRRLVADYRVSESTAKRRIRDTRAVATI